MPIKGGRKSWSKQCRFQLPKKTVLLIFWDEGIAFNITARLHLLFCKSWYLKSKWSVNEPRLNSVKLASHINTRLESAETTICFPLDSPKNMFWWSQRRPTSFQLKGVNMIRSTIFLCHFGNLATLLSAESGSRKSHGETFWNMRRLRPSSRGGLWLLFTAKDKLHCDIKVYIVAILEIKVLLIKQTQSSNTELWWMNHLK